MRIQTCPVLDQQRLKTRMTIWRYPSLSLKVSLFILHSLLRLDVSSSVSCRSSDPLHFASTAPGLFAHSYDGYALLTTFSIRHLHHQIPLIKPTSTAHFRFLSLYPITLMLVFIAYPAWRNEKVLGFMLTIPFRLMPVFTLFPTTLSATAHCAPLRYVSSSAYN